MSDRVSEGPKQNTDHELWRESDDRSQCTPSIHVTQDGGIGINVGGTVKVRTLREWHAAMNPDQSIRIAELEAELASLRDDPEFDATDAAHPAWWRGHEHTTAVFCQLVNEILDRKPDGGGIASQPWEATRKRLHELVAQLAALDEKIAELAGACRAAHGLLDEHLAGMIRLGHQKRNCGTLTESNEQEMSAVIADVERVKAMLPITTALAALDSEGRG
jgi:hypothetical protein